MELQSEIWILAVVIGSLYMLVKYIQECREKIRLKVRTKEMVESIIEVKIYKKEMVDGLPMSTTVSGKFAYPRYPDTCMIFCSDENRDYSFDDKDTFDNYDVGDVISIKIVERIDKNDCVISYRIVDIL